MGKFTKSKNVPSFLKEPNYYAKHEKFDDDIEESVEECQTCGDKKYMEPTQEHMVKSFDRFLIEKKGVDLTGDGKVDGEDWKAARDIAIKGSKAKAKTSAKGKAIELPAPKAKKKAKPVEEEPEVESVKGKKPTKKAKPSTKLTEGFDHYAMVEGHTCHCGTKMMTSEAAHYLIESVCEGIMEDAKHYAEHVGSFEDYINECGNYMDSKLYDLVDDGSSHKINENWANESACYESTKMQLDEMCEALCHEALHIHNDHTPREFDQYVKEGIGCYRNGMMECAGYGMNEDIIPAMGLINAIKSKEADKPKQDPNEIIRKFKQMANDPRTLKLSPQKQAELLGITVDELIDLAKSTNI